MKQRIVLSLFAVISVIVLCSNAGGYNSNVTGSQSANSGCPACHGSTSSIGTTIELDSAGVPVTSYRPGLAYTVKLSATNNTGLSLPRFGCQLSLVKLANAGTGSAQFAGTWGTMPSGITSHGLWLGQNMRLSPASGTGGNGTVYSVSVPWTAPIAGTGSVKLYGIINAVNNNGTDDNGDKGQFATAVTITEYVAPVAASVSIALTTGTNPTCQSTQVGFTATPTNGGTGPIFQWFDGSTQVATGTTFNSVSLSPGTHSITCVMTSNLPGATGSPATSNAISLVVNAPAIDSVRITSSATNVCAGTSLTFTATPYNGGSTPSYVWQDGATNLGTGPTISISSLSAGTHTISCVMTPSGSCFSPSASTSNAITVTVNAPVTDSVRIASSLPGICAGSPVTLTATPYNGGSSPTYEWRDGTNPIGTSNPLTISTLATGTRNIICLMTSSLCATPSPAASNVIAVIVQPTVTPTITLSGTSTVCSGSSDTIRATITNGGPSPSYSWTVNSGAAGTNSPTLVIPSVSANSSVVCTLTSNAGCTTSASVASTPFSITASSSVAPTIQITTADDTVCSGAIILFTASSTGGGTNPAYQWRVNSNTASGTTSNFSLVNPASGDVVSCILTSSLTCASPQQATSNSITLRIATPSATLTPSGNIHICAGDSVLLTASGGASYAWSTGQQTATIFAGQSIPYTVTVTDAHGCTATAPDSAVVTASSPAVPVITQTGFTLTSTSAPHYQWLLDNNALATDTTQSITATANGSYNVIVTDANGCATPSAAFAMTGVGIEDVDAENAIHLYPVPNHGSFAVDIQSYGGTSLTIYDIYGKEVYYRDLTAAHTEISDADLSAALYFVQIRSGNRQHTVKMQVAK